MSIDVYFIKIFEIFRLGEKKLTVEGFKLEDTGKAVATELKPLRVIPGAFELAVSTAFD